MSRENIWPEKQLGLVRFRGNFRVLEVVALLNILTLIICMDPAEVEFLAEKENITIVPNFSQDRIYLIGVSFVGDKRGIPGKLIISVVFSCH